MTLESIPNELLKADDFLESEENVDLLCEVLSK